MFYNVIFLAYPCGEDRIVSIVSDRNDTTPDQASKDLILKRFNSRLNVHEELLILMSIGLN